MIAIYPLLLLACTTAGDTGTSTPQIGTPSGSASGASVGTPTGTVTSGTCPASYTPILQSVCLSSSDAAASERPLLFDDVLATVVGPPGPVGHPAAWSHTRCQGSGIPADQQLELMADDGSTWVVGFDTEGAVDGIVDALAILTPGTQVTLKWGDQSDLSMTNRLVALHDDQGPVVSWSMGWVHPDTLGLEARRSDAVCVVSGPYDYEVYQQRFTASDGSTLDLWASERGTLVQDGRTLEIESADDRWWSDCSDGCGFNGYAIWAVSP